MRIQCPNCERPFECAAQFIGNEEALHLGSFIITLFTTIISALFLVVILRGFVRVVSAIAETACNTRQLLALKQAKDKEK